MSEKLPLDKHEENTNPIVINQPYTRSATSVGDVAKDDNAPTLSRQSDTRSAGKGMSPGLSRALVGGLIGVTLGTLAGAFANKKSAKAVNHATKAVGDGVKTVGEGVNHAAKGVGNAVKSVAEGVNYAVIGAVESLKDAAEDVEQSTVIAVDAVKDTTEDVKQSAVGAIDAVKDKAEDAKQSAVGAVDSLKNPNQDVKPSNAEDFNLDEQVTANNNQVTTSEVSTAQEFNNQTAEILVLLETEGVVDQNTLDAETKVFLSEVGFLEGESDRPEIY